MYAFSKLSAVDLRRLHSIITSIPPFKGIKYNVGEMSAALPLVTYRQTRNLSAILRANFSNYFTKISVVSHSDIADETLRVQILAWLEQNDSNGIYTDRAIMDEGLELFTFEDAAQSLALALGVE